MAPHGRWWSYAGDLLAIQVVGVAALVVNAGALLRRDRVLRRARATYRAQLIELSAATPELVLLGRAAFANERASASVERLRRAEKALANRRSLASAVAPAMTALAVAALVVRPASAALWIVVAAVLALSTFELLNVMRDALDTGVAVSAAAERLEELDLATRRGHVTWPAESTLRFDHVSINEAGEILVADATFSITTGRRVALAGASGAGKSTLLRAVAALDDVQGGAITIGGISVTAIDERDLRRLVAYVAAEPGLTRGYAVDVVRLGRSTTRDVTEDLAALGLFSDATTRWDDLSRGERARIAIARAMVTSPTLYLLDEPTSGLGVEETSAVLSLLAATNATVLIATHDPQVMAWCDEVFELFDGELRPLRR
jgi:ABC-type transport system involved in cytochrome bd biosynthesis fused ATPase/permease subunit